jgi:hypothetical protein
MPGLCEFVISMSRALASHATGAAPGIRITYMAHDLHWAAEVEKRNILCSTWVSASADTIKNFILELERMLRSDTERRSTGKREKSCNVQHVCARVLNQVRLRHRELSDFSAPGRMILPSLFCDTVWNGCCPCLWFPWPHTHTFAITNFRPSGYASFVIWRQQRHDLKSENQSQHPTHRSGYSKNILHNAYAESIVMLVVPFCVDVCLWQKTFLCSISPPLPTCSAHLYGNALVICLHLEAMWKIAL